ncbi:hypothetical protein SKAU_G00267000 [Synaphobranchus kaupii]|uniref:Uncharacterized protein n=1 Tax=Synaphobranchus kaupii TaxID=118154 RepID=A0A9Q1EZM3_SYNKA|nr:hypothetical protein SKAU_G00267000 [Synaphobranchus kaupii]
MGRARASRCPSPADCCMGRSVTLSAFPAPLACQRPSRIRMFLYVRTMQAARDHMSGHLGGCGLWMPGRYAAIGRSVPMGRRSSPTPSRSVAFPLTF